MSRYDLDEWDRKQKDAARGIYDGSKGKPWSYGIKPDQGVTTHWRKLREINGYTRLPDHVDFRTGQHRRMVQCDDCGLVLAALGVGYHKQGGACGRGEVLCRCFKPRFDLDRTVFSWDGVCGHEKVCELQARPSAVTKIMQARGQAAADARLAELRAATAARVAEEAAAREAEEEVSRMAALIRPVRQLRPGQVVEAIRTGGEDWVTPSGFPAELAMVTDNADGTVTLTLATDHWDRNRHVPAEWLVRLADGGNG